MIEMPPLQFAQVNGIRMGYYEAGPKSDTPPVVLCHGWPEMAFSWRHQIKALSEAGIRVIAPDQRGYGATDRPEPVEAYDIEHLTGDLVGLLDHLKIDKAIFVGHDWGGFVVWQMPLRHIDRVAGVIGVNTPHLRPPAGRSDRAVAQALRRQMYIVQFQNPAREPDRIFGSRVEQTFDAFMRKPLPRTGEARRRSADRRRRRVGAANLAFPQMIAAYDAKSIRARRSCRRRRRRCSSTPSREPASPAASTGTATSPATGSARQGSTKPFSVPSLMIMAENDAVLPPSAADGMERLVPDLEKYLVRDSGHWTQQEKPEEVSAKLIEWRRKRFG